MAHALRGDTPDKDATTVDLMQAALAYARCGLAVLPLVPRQKHPATPHGVLDATCDATRIRAWWQALPHANVGIACGAASLGLVVVDLDTHGATDGVQALAYWEYTHHRLPRTLTVKTGTGGRHLYFRMQAPPRNSVNAQLGIDVRGEGGYVVAPPSAHPNGQAYELAPGSLAAIASADEAVRELLAWVRNGADGASGHDRAPVGPTSTHAPALTQALRQGSRNDTLFRHGCSLRARGADEAEVRERLVRANACLCTPPLPEREVAAIVRSVCRYPQGSPVGATRRKERPHPRT